MNQHSKSLGLLSLEGFLAMMGRADSLVTKHEDTLYDTEGKINLIFHHPPENDWDSLVFCG